MKNAMCEDIRLKIRESSSSRSLLQVHRAVKIKAKNGTERCNWIKSAYFKTRFNIIGAGREGRL